MSRGQRAKNLIYDDWAGDVNKYDIDITPVTDRVTMVKYEINELRKEIEQIKIKQQKTRKITIKVR